MKIIEVDDELYHYIASKTERIGEPASAILRRLLGFGPLECSAHTPSEQPQTLPLERQDEISAIANGSELVSEAAENTVEVEPPVEIPNKLEAKEPTTAKIAEAQTSSTTSNKVSSKSKAKKTRNVKPRELTPEELKEAEAVAKLTPSKQLQQLEFNSLSLQHGAVGRFVYLLSVLEQQHQQQFSGVVNIKGKGRLYFADNEAELIETGSSTNPKQIGHSRYWVITNNNTSRKKSILSEVAKMLGYNANDLRILAAKI